eukprot:CAMPEP_0206622494 /NCGR_PEP_ID=MMETSP0325_2-20121206/62837_1 /ASSEMBLY_ACC=CAM_ASM_000347 /TAXON_ID=2866 /ORGANISM="Crypthecodinium cohnii, Strain Seligo" /LENGTH=146 /DNA_ID=CAMNT_0054145825 /DNA_START=270 /DNA_END=710 /DNA_ORIENTATION=+
MTTFLTRSASHWAFEDLPQGLPADLSSWTQISGGLSERSRALLAPPLLLGSTAGQGCVDCQCEHIHVSLRDAHRDEEDGDERHEWRSVLMHGPQDEVSNHHVCGYDGDDADSMYNVAQCRNDAEPDDVPQDQEEGFLGRCAEVLSC